MQDVILKFLLLVKAELKREYLFLKRYPMEIISFLFFMYVILMAIILGISQLSENGQLNIDQNRMIIGYCLMQFVMSSQMGWAGQISNESQTGTLEQLSISGHRLGTVLFARGLSQFPRQVLSFFLLMGAYLFSMPKLTLSLENFYIVTGMLLCIAIGVYGVAYIFAGATLLFKRVGSFFQIINFGFLGLFWQDRSSLDDSSISAILYDSFPLTLGMKNLNHIFNNDGSSILLLFANQIFYSIIFGISGYLLFALMEKKARKMALLSQY